jgi:hypothetical protein
LLAALPLLAVLGDERSLLQMLTFFGHIFPNSANLRFAEILYVHTV